MRGLEEEALEGEHAEFQKILETAVNDGKIVLNDAMEDMIAGKPFSEIQPLVGKLSDRATRKWYLAQDAQIPSLVDKSLSPEDQARMACELRNQNRTNARDLMEDQEARQKLDRKDPNKTFDELIADKMSRKGLTRDQAIEDIYRTATKPRKSVNQKYGLE